MSHFFQVKIERLVYGGSGLGFVEGQAVFIPLSAPGDHLAVEIVARKKGVLWGKIKEIITPSPARTPPFCPHFTKCGGCQWQHILYADQVVWKQRILEDTLRRLGGIRNVKVGSCLPSMKERHYRHRVRLHVKANCPIPQVGFYRQNSHKVVSIEGCPLLTTEMNCLLKQLSVLLKAHTMNKLTEIQMVQGSTGTPVLHLSTKARISMSKEINSLPAAGVTFDSGDDSKILWGDGFVKISTREMEFQSSSGTFFQANLGLLNTLADQILEMAEINQNDQAVELYSGMGIWGCLLSCKTRKLFTFESNPLAAGDALINISRLKIDNIVPYSLSAELGLEMVSKQGFKPDLILMDPPREGLSKEVCWKLLEMKPKRIIYISCNPATLARDLKLLLSDGQVRIDQIQPLDMFPHTFHIECVVHLSRDTSIARIIRDNPGFATRSLAD